MQRKPIQTRGEHATLSTDLMLGIELGTLGCDGDLLDHILSNKSDRCFLIPCGIKKMSALSNKNRIMKPVARR